MEALLQATGLPADLVDHALTPLIHGEGILVRSCMPGGECGAGAPLGSEPQVGAGVGVHELVGEASGLG